MALGTGVTFPTVTKGRIVVPGRGITYQFMFNPSKITDTKVTNFGAIELPGASHPVYQFGSGGERLIKFDLYLDGDRGRVGRRDAGAVLDVTDEISLLRSLIYPSLYGSTGKISTVYPFTVIFTFGTWYNGVLCIVKKADPSPSFFTPKLEIVRATVSMELAEIVDRSVQATDIYRTPGEAAAAGTIEAAKSAFAAIKGFF